MAGETIERAKVSRIGDAAELAENLRQLRTQLRWHGAGDCTHFETVHARFGEVARIVGMTKTTAAVSAVLFALLTKAETETAAALEALGYEVDVE